MADFLSGFSVQHWLESAPQGYLLGTESGHHAGEQEPRWLLDDPTLRERAIASTVQLVVGERCARAVSAGLVNAAPDEATSRYFATQALDEARHAEVFEQRLLDLAVAQGAVEDVIRDAANPNLLRLTEALLERVDRRDYVAALVGQNLILDGMALHVFELIHARHEGPNPKFAHTLAGTIADERRHVGLGEALIAGVLRRDPARRSDVERLQRDLSYWVLASLADQFASEPPSRASRGRRRSFDAKRPHWRGHDLDSLEPDELEKLLAHTVLEEFKMRLARIGLTYQTPVRS